MALVSWQDVQDRLLGRTLSEAEQSTVDVWIGDLESDIRLRVPDLGERAADLDYLNSLKAVVFAAVKRVLDNPKGLRQRTVSIDDYSTTETVDVTASAGALYLTDEDWNKLLPGSAGDAFTIRSYAAPGYAYPSPFDRWS